MAMTYSSIKLKEAARRQQLERSRPPAGRHLPFVLDDVDMDIEAFLLLLNWWGMSKLDSRSFLCSAGATEDER